MPIYGVVMNQAVSMDNLGANVLITGYKSPEYLYSCSAVILANPANDSAGLYHFPSGDIYADLGSRALLADMIRRIAPTRAWLYYGIQPGYNIHKPPYAPTDVAQTNNLLHWLQGQLGFAVLHSPAIYGSASIRIAAGQPIITDARNFQDQDDLMDLDGHLRGLYNPPGFRVYVRENTQENLGPVVFGGHRTR